MVNVSQDALDKLRVELSERIESMDTFYLLVFGSIVLLMQCGFAFLEAGTVRSKNTTNILLKNLLDIFLAGLSYWTAGYAFAYGEGNGFIGWTKWVSSGVNDLELASWYFQFVFAATAATIVSGALAERCEFVAYLVYSVGITGIIYPIVTHWVWSDHGWLAVGNTYVINGHDVVIGFTDFAGSGAVHVLGGVASFCGAYIMGPRIGRFHSATGTAVPIRGHSVPFSALGGFILIFGFMAFNGGSQLAVSSHEDAAAVATAVVNTVLSGSTAAFVALFLQRTGLFGEPAWSLLMAINGCLAGMVAICAGCNAVKPWAAVCQGAIAGMVYLCISNLMVRIKVDDPLDAVAVHFGGGVCGVLGVAFFHWESGILTTWSKQAGLMLAWQFVGLVSIALWTACLACLVFGSLKYFGKLRVTPEIERKGLDIFKHKEPSYPMESYGHGYNEQILTIMENGDLSRIQMGFADGTKFESYEVEYMRQKSNQSANEVMTTKPPKSLLNGTANGVAHKTTNDAPNGTTNGVANGTAKSNGTANGVANGTAKRNGTANGVAAHKGKANGALTGTAKDMARQNEQLKALLAPKVADRNESTPL